MVSSIPFQKPPEYHLRWSFLIAFRTSFSVIPVSRSASIPIPLCDLRSVKAKRCSGVTSFSVIGLVYRSCMAHSDRATNSISK